MAVIEVPLENREGSEEFGGRSEQFAEFFDAEAGIADDTRHGDGIHGVVPWDRNFANSIGHDDVLPLPHDLETRLFQCSNCQEMINSGQLGHD